MPSHLRIARPVTDLDRAVRMYVDGLGLQALGGFRDHEGFDGVMLGEPGAGHHLEDNAGALDVSLSSADLAAIDAAFPRDLDAGQRYPDAMMGSLNG